MCQTYKNIIRIDSLCTSSTAQTTGKARGEKMITTEKDYVFESTAQYRSAEVRNALESVPKRRYLQ